MQTNVRMSDTVVYHMISQLLSKDQPKGHQDSEDVDFTGKRERFASHAAVLAKKAVVQCSPQKSFKEGCTGSV